MTTNALAIAANEIGPVLSEWGEAAPLDPAVDHRRFTSLESERMGLLANASSFAPVDLKLESWIASNLDIDAERAPGPRNVWNRIVEGLPRLRRAPKKTAATEAGATRSEGWPRFHLGYKRGITLVRLRDAALLKESLIQELTCDLLDLIEAGNRRVVLNFGRVERLASLMVMAVKEAALRCQAGDGGALKVCGLSPEMSAIFPLAGMGARVAFHADEAAAIDGPWPAASGPRPLPVEVLTALLTAADLPPVRGGAPVEVPMPSAKEGPLPEEIPTPPRVRALPAELWLSVSAGAARGRLIAVSGPKFLIGRDPGCNLRLGSPMVSKLHAALLRRDDRFFLRDLGSTNGTILNGRSLRGGEAELHPGDRIQVGPIVATFLTAPQQPDHDQVEDQVAGWLRPDQDDERSEQIGWDETLTLPTRGADEPEAGGGPTIKSEIIQEVLVVTPKASALDDLEAVERLRIHLRALFDSPTPREVVVNLEYVGNLSAQAIGVLLAHHLRLDHAGGAMRICQARARVMAVLHQVRLTMLVECYPTVDEAVLGAWPGHAKKQLAAES